MLRVYIAAPYPCRDYAIRVMTLLEANGVDVTSRWLKAPDELSDKFAREDLADVTRADVLLALNPKDWADRGTGGRHVEFGYALAQAKPIILVGERSHIFHHLDHVVVVPDVAEAIIAALVNVPVPRATGMTPDAAVALVVAEFRHAHAKHAPMHSPHEAYAVIQEEVDELWDEVKADRGRTDTARREATQIAAMGLRYLVDVSVG